jgi:hypothetical protein
MKRYVANIRVEVSSESKESLDCVLEAMVDTINRRPPSMTFTDVGTAAVKRAKLGRVRPALRPAR